MNRRHIDEIAVSSERIHTNRGKSKLHFLPRLFQPQQWRQTSLATQSQGRTKAPCSVLEGQVLWGSTWDSVSLIVTGRMTLKKQQGNVFISHWRLRNFTGLSEFHIIRKYNRKLQRSVIPHDFILDHMKKSADYNNYLSNETIWLRKLLFWDINLLKHKLTLLTEQN